METGAVVGNHVVPDRRAGRSIEQDRVAVAGDPVVAEEKAAEVADRDAFVVQRAVRVVPIGQVVAVAGDVETRHLDVGRGDLEGLGGGVAFRAQNRGASLPGTDQSHRLVHDHILVVSPRSHRDGVTRGGGVDGGLDGGMVRGNRDVGSPHGAGGSDDRSGSQQAGSREYNGFLHIGGGREEWGRLDYITSCCTRRAFQALVGIPSKRSKVTRERLPTANLNFDKILKSPDRTGPPSDTSRRAGPSPTATFITCSAFS